MAYIDDDVDAYTLCSIASSNETADDLPGPGRTLGKLYSFIGTKIERGLGRAAERIRYGPRATALKILKIQENKMLLPAPTRRKRLEKNCVRLARYVRYDKSSDT